MFQNSGVDAEISAAYSFKVWSDLGTVMGMHPFRLYCKKKLLLMFPEHVMLMGDVTSHVRHETNGKTAKPISLVKGN